MAKFVHRYEVQLVPSSQLIDLPKGSRIISSAIWKDCLSIWAEVDRHEPTPVRHEIVIVGTGHQAPPQDKYRFLNTVLDGDVFVWHVYCNIE